MIWTENSGRRIDDRGLEAHTLMVLGKGRYPGKEGGEGQRRWIWPGGGCCVLVLVPGPSLPGWPRQTSDLSLTSFSRLSHEMGDPS